MLITFLIVFKLLPPNCFIDFCASPRIVPVVLKYALKKKKTGLTEELSLEKNDIAKTALPSGSRPAAHLGQDQHSD